MKKIIAALLSVIGLFSYVSQSALAIEFKPFEKTIEMVNYTYPIKFNGRQIVCLNEDKSILPVLQYQGTTYVPLQTAGELMGQIASWDGARNVTISGEAPFTVHYVSDYVDAPRNLSDKVRFVTAKLCMDMRLEWDDTHWIQTDANLKALSVISYENNIYLSLRNIAEAKNMKIEWHAPTGTTSEEIRIYSKK